MSLVSPCYVTRCRDDMAVAMWSFSPRAVKCKGAWLYISDICAVDVNASASNDANNSHVYIESRYAYGLFIHGPRG